MTIKKILDEMVSWRSRPSQRERLSARALDKEYPDPRPVALPVGYDIPPTMTELIQQYVRHEVSQAALEDGQGSFEEEDDFTEEDHQPLPWEPYAVNEYEMEADEDMPSVEGAEPAGDVTDPAAVPAEPPKSEGDDAELQSKQLT